MPSRSSLRIGANPTLTGIDPVPEPETYQEVPGDNDSSVPETPKQPEGSMTIKITVGSNVFKADIENTETGSAN